jgi:hypothetical protein
MSVNRPDQRAVAGIFFNDLVDAVGGFRPERRQGFQDLQWPQRPQRRTSRRYVGLQKTLPVVAIIKEGFVRSFYGPHDHHPSPQMPSGQRALKKARINKPVIGETCTTGPGTSYADTGTRGVFSLLLRAILQRQAKTGR